MSHRELVNKYLKRFGKKIGIPDLTLDEDNYCAIQFDENIQVNIEVVGEENEEIVCFYSSVKEVPKNNQEELFYKLLELNLFGLQTNGACFAIHPEANEILLCFTWVSSKFMEYESFEECIESLSIFTKHWRNEL
jgi:hypothetical protein